MNLTRVSKSHPCPVCGKPDWCAYNGTIAICMRIESPKPSENGGWVHILNGKVKPPDPPVNCKIPRRPDQELDKVYRQLLRMLPLNKAHIEHLRSRGMGDFEIEKGMYRSLPVNREPIISRLDPSDLPGVPGFGLNKKGRWVLTGKPGLIIPVVQNDLVVSFLIRPDKTDSRNKYQILSSSWLDQGSSPGPRVHIAVPETIYDQDTGWIVEGPLKGNIVAERVGAIVFSVPGVSSWKELKSMKLPRTDIVAYDNDYHNFWVRYHARKLSNYLINKKHEVYAALWDNTYKGPDDALANEAKIKLYKLFWRKLPIQKNNNSFPGG